jgi:hypothetical protein
MEAVTERIGEDRKVVKKSRQSHCLEEREELKVEESITCMFCTSALPPPQQGERERERDRETSGKGKLPTPPLPSPHTPSLAKRERR